jgi:hypothetical protein
LDSAGLEYCPVIGVYYHVDEPSIQDVKFIDLLFNYQLFKEDSSCTDVEQVMGN